jgi:hypothetical protein
MSVVQQLCSQGAAMVALEFLERGKIQSGIFKIPPPNVSAKEWKAGDSSPPA